ncbi:MAG: hypothetical protein ACXVQU_12910 [Actinomycetota bacterium]
MKGVDVRRNLTIPIACVLALLTAACASETSSLGPVPTSRPTGGGGQTTTATTAASSSPTSITGGTGTTINGSGSAVPTTSPGVTGSVTHGAATLSVSGALQTTQPALLLSSPAIYAPAPGGFALNWTSGAAGFAMSGTSFVGTDPTSVSLHLTLSVHASSGTRTFSSTDGQCQVTVSQADAHTFIGAFSCAGLSDTTGSSTVTAQGTFAATG